MYERPVTISEPIYNDQGFGVGFRLSHPEGVECGFHPESHQCSCGRLDVGLVPADDDGAVDS